MLLSKQITERRHLRLLIVDLCIYECIFLHVSPGTGLKRQLKGFKEPVIFCLKHKRKGLTGLETENKS